jgi:hypothetical protein
LFGEHECSTGLGASGNENQAFADRAKRRLLSDFRIRAEDPVQPLIGWNF